MKIVVAAAEEQWKELTGGIQTKAAWLRVKDKNAFTDHSDAMAFFNLQENASEENYSTYKKPVFINSVAVTLKEMNAPAHVLRMNGWKSFLQRPAWEIAGVIDENIVAILAALNKKIIAVPDEPGMIAARTIAMIVNEAYFALMDKVSSKKEIDIAMKLGTGYPFGPFEWANTIGVQNILVLLQKLYASDKRYKPASLLIKEAVL